MILSSYKIIKREVRGHPAQTCILKSIKQQSSHPVHIICISPFHFAIATPLTHSHSCHSYRLRDHKYLLLTSTDCRQLINTLFITVSLFFFFWPCHTTCRILVSRPGTEPTPSALKAESYPLNCQENPSPRVCAVENLADHHLLRLYIHYGVWKCCRCLEDEGHWLCVFESGLLPLWRLCPLSTLRLQVFALS